MQGELQGQQGTHVEAVRVSLCSGESTRSYGKALSQCPGPILPELLVNGPLCLPRVRHSRLKRGN